MRVFIDKRMKEISIVSKFRNAVAEIQECRGLDTQLLIRLLSIYRSMLNLEREIAKLSQ